MPTTRLLAALCLTTLPACVEGPLGDGGPDTPTDPTAPSDPDAPDQPDTPDVPAPLVCEGGYQLDTALDIQAAAVMPQPVYDAIEVVRGLRDAPAETLFDLAEQAGVPAVGEIRDALPSSLESRLYGWIDAKLATFTHGDGPIAVAIDLVLRVAEASIAEVRVGSDLTLDETTATHRVRDVTFTIEGLEVTRGLDDLAGVLDLEATVAFAATPAGDDARVVIGAHAFGLPFGELALAAIDDVLVARLGADLRGALGLLIDCPTLAAEVADRCYLGVCVGHEAELRAVCEAGLDEAADQIRERLRAVRFDALTLAAGAATLRDGTPSDRVADELVDGAWDATIDVGMGPRAAPATFAGARAN